MTPTNHSSDSHHSFWKGVKCSDRYTEIYKTSPKGDVLVETDRSTYSRMLFGLTKLTRVPVKVSLHRSLNTSRGVIRSRDIGGCSVEEIVEELQPQGVTAAVIIHVRDGDSRRRTNTVNTDVCISTSAKIHHSRLPEGLYRAIHSQSSALLQVPTIRPQFQSLQERCYMCEMWESWPRRSELLQPSKMCQLQR